jgi:NADH:ubiquinone oxidoreductase subunit 6 (subunit J)
MDFFCFSLAVLLSLVPHLISGILAFIFYLLGVGFWLLHLNLDFLALIFSLIYVGAIAVLFIFITLLIHFIDTLYLSEMPTQGQISYTVFQQSQGVTSAVFLETFILFFDFFDNDFDLFYDCLDTEVKSSFMDLLYTNSEIYGLAAILFTVYWLPFLITVLILLVLTLGIFFILFIF